MKRQNWEFFDLGSTLRFHIFRLDWWLNLNFLIEAYLQGCYLIAYI